MDNKEKETVVIPGTEDKDVKVISFDEPKWKNGSYVDFVRSHGAIMVDTRTTQSPDGKEIPLSCTLITSDDRTIENALKMKAEGVSKYLKVDVKGDIAVIRGVPYRSRRKVGEDEAGKPLYENNLVSVPNVFFNHDMCICDGKSAEHLRAAKHDLANRLKGKNRWETNLSLVVPLDEIPEYKPVDAILREESSTPTIMVAGAFFMDDKDYKEFCDRLEDMGNKVIRQETGNEHTFEEYSRFMEDVEIDYMSARDPNLQDYNPMKAVVEKIDKALAANGHVVPDMVIIPDKAKEAAETRLYNGRVVLENERRYYSITFNKSEMAIEGAREKDAPEPRVSVRNETYEYTDRNGKPAKGSIWQSPSVHNEKLPSLDEVLSGCRQEFASMSNYTAERVVANTIDRMASQHKSPDSPSKGVERERKRSRSEISFG